MKVIVLEGMDGSGKTTVCRNLVSRLKETGLKAVYIKSLPDDSILGKTTRELLSTTIDNDIIVQLMLANASMVSRSMKLLASDGVDVVIVDRWILSTLAYGRLGMDINTKYKNEYGNIVSLIDSVLKLNDISVDATIYLDVDIETSKARTASRNENDMYTGKLEQIKTAYDISIIEFRSSQLKPDTMRNIGEIYTVDANDELDVVVDDCLDLVNTLYKD
jgi:dTMP kinase